MLALITGASSGIGRDIARVLSSKGYDLILVARREERMKELAAELKTKCEIIVMDVSSADKCRELFSMTRDKNVDILINNAGFGIFGDFDEIDLDSELKLISVNVEALHVLTKLFLQEFADKNKGYILNVASIAGFMSGPQMAAYYASKNYVLSLSSAIYEELRRKKSNVSISILCPGPVRTEFSRVANVDFSIASISSEKTAKIAVDKMLRGKLIIIPGIMNKLSVFMSRFVSRKFLLKIVYSMQSLKKR